MNRNELKHMLSQVDEQYIAELLDAEETTMEAAPVTRTSRRFKGWAAAAAIVCVIGVGGGCLALRGSMGVPPASEVSSSVTDHEAYDLIWEELPEEQLCIDYAQPEGGTFVSKNFPVLPFETAQFTIANAYFHCNDNGDADYVFIGMDGNHQTVELWISDSGQLYSSHFEVDLHADVEREKPAIHIYDTTPIYGDVEHSVPMYEVYYLNNGIAMSMKLRNVTAAEAEAMAATLLLEETSAKSIYEATSLYDQYFVRDVSEITTHRNEFSLDMGGEHLSASGTVLPYPESLFTDASTNIYCTADGTPDIAQVVLTGDNGRYADIVLHDHGDYLSVFPIPGDSAGLERNGIPFYGFRSAKEDDYRELYFVTEYGVGCSMLCKGVPDAEILALADSIIQQQIDAAFLSGMQDPAPSEPATTEPTSGEAETDYFGCTQPIDPMIDLSQQTWHRFYQPSDVSLPFSVDSFETQEITVYCTDASAPAAASILLQTADKRMLLIKMGDQALMFGESGITAEGGTERNGVTLYGWRSPVNPNYFDLCFTMGSTDYCINAEGLSEEELLAVADGIISTGFTPASLQESLPH